MSIKLIALTSVNPDEEDALLHYLSVVGPLMTAAGAELIERIELGKAIVGSDMPQFMTIMEYPSEEAINRVFLSAEYQGLKSIRQKAFSHYQISIERQNDV